MNALDALRLEGGLWRWGVLGALVLGLVALGWSYRTAAGIGGWRWGCLFLKALGLAALAVCLLDPLWTSRRAKPGENLFLVVADNSAGLQIRDVGQATSRGEWLRDQLDPGQREWPSLLAENFAVRLHRFDRRLELMRDPADLDFEGPASALRAALRSLAERIRGRPAAGILLFTDGNATDRGEGALDVSGLPPVFPVVVGRDEPIPDLSIERVQITQTDFEDAPVTIQADLRAAGLRRGEIVVRLVDSAGRVEQAQTLAAPGSEGPLTCRFRLRPKERGLAFYQLTATAGAGQGESGRVGIEEATLANNRQGVVVDRGRGPHRVLYVGGRPDWEFKFLNRAVAADEQLQMTALIRVARREPKFEFRGRSGETSNPLYRGFEDQGREGVERYDQPVLVRLNTVDELELRAGFPMTAEDLYRFEAVIVDDVEAAFFLPDQALLVQKFVSERGGGFLMLGGADSFQQGAYDRTPIGDLLPVYLDRVTWTNPAPRLRLNLTREGWLQPWARLRDQESDERARLERMPPLQVINPVQTLKPGASVLATATAESGESYPALVVQRFGRGRTAALTVGDWWRWGLRDPESHRDLDKAWRQLVRWLVADVPRRVDLQAVREAEDASQAVPLQVRVRDARFQPLDGAAVTVEIEQVTGTGDAFTRAGTNRVRLPAEPVSREAGLYEASFVPRLAGGYVARAWVTNEAGAEVGHAEVGWTTDPGADEFRVLRPNRPLLEDVARRTGGQMVPADRLEAFVRELPRRQAPIMEPWSRPLWHTPAWFLLAVGCFIAEWGLRRWRGLP